MKNDFQAGRGSPFQSSTEPSTRLEHRCRLSGSGRRAEQDAVLHVGGLWSRECRHLDCSPRRARGPICAWSSRASGRISSRPMAAPRAGGSSSLRTWSRSWRGWTEVCRGQLRGGLVELERVGSAGAPLAVNCLYGWRARLHRRHGTGANPRLGWASWRWSRSSCCWSPVSTCSCCPMLSGGAAGDASQERNGEKDTIMSKSETGKSPSQLIDARIKELGDWRGEMLGKLRALIKEADPTSSRSGSGEGSRCGRTTGSICTGETYKAVVKMTFAKGASLEDPVAPLQLQPRRQHPARHRFPRGREDRREGVEDAHPRRRDTEHVQGAKADPRKQTFSPTSFAWLSHRMSLPGLTGQSSNPCV